MQHITVKLLELEYKIEFDGVNTDERSAMRCEDEDMLEVAVAVSVGEQDGRGIPMSNGSFTPIGVARCLRENGYDVGELAPPPPDMDGAQE
ncbi:MAG: hypothetical protein ACRCT2_00355 [Plesiomonas shigelloides]